MAKITSHIITVSEYDKNLALKNNVAKNEDMTVIHNCIDDHITNTRPPANKSGPVRLLMVARFGVPKDHSLLLKALKECRDLNWELYLVGGGDHTKYRSLCSEYRLEDRVYFLGQRQDVASIMNESDIFLLISKWEGFPISIVEAMRAGLPVIASNVGGVSESVTEGQTGFLTPRDNADILIDRIRSLITDKDLCIQMGTQGYKDFQDKFTLQKMTEKTLHVYETYSN